jgi:ABC-type thiamine transport system ATPase subunit
MAKATASERPIELKRLRLRDGDILVIREPSFDLNLREKMLERVKAVNKANVLVLFVTQLSDVKALSPEQLQRIMNSDT